MNILDTKNICIPVYLNPLYVSSKHIERVELLLDVYPNIGSFFNAVCSNTLIRLIEDGSIRDYQVGTRDEEDAIVSNHFEKSFFEHIDEKKFGSRLLDDIGYSSSELKTKLKTVAFYLIEATLATVYEYISDYASEQGKRLSSILALSIVNELGDHFGLPTRVTVEATILLDEFRRITCA